MTPHDLRRALRERVLVIDGAMGTMIQSYDLGPADFGGADLEGCNENLVLTRADVIREIHEAYLDAGADVIETNTFGATRIVLAEYGLQEKAREINREAAKIARAAADKFSTAEKPRWVAGSIGPTTKTISVTGGITFDLLHEAYWEQALGLIEGGVDALLVETSQDTLNVKAAALGIRAAQEELGTNLPVLLSATIEPMGTMLAGQSIDAFYAAVEHFEPAAIGLNCATGPEFMTDHVRTLSELSRFPVSVYPNAGLPDENGHYDETPDSLAAKLGRFLDQGWLNLVGGCCGTTPAHIRKIAEIAKRAKPRAAADARRRLVSGIDALEVTGAASERPILVGERTNVIGSRKFKRLIEEGKLEEAAEVARAQVKGGAQVIDICLANPDRDEFADLADFLPHVAKKTKAPWMIDSTDARAIELALKHSQGKAIVNSINLEDGEERFEKVVPLIRKYGAAVVVGTIDEDKTQGMAVTSARKLAVAERSYNLLTQKYGLAPEDIIFDPLVFPCGTGDVNYVGSAKETVEGVRLITERFPRCTTVLGISNVSFGLPEAGREVLNSVFLYHCVQAGLTYAIVNSEKVQRYASIPEGERKLAEDLIYWRGEDPVAAFTAHFREKKTTKDAPSARAALPLDERLARCIVEGTKEGLFADLDLALKERTPLDIINGPLMAGMTEVGRLFNANELIVAEVLQSAEAMKAAVDHLKPHMPRANSATRGKILLATVKGDVHDIGKNLVEIILGNNGYDIVNLGIKVPPEEIVRAVREHKPDAIGLSGLLVKSAQQMVVTAEDLRNAGVKLPLFVGGAALTRGFTNKRIALAYDAPTIYARDAMQGLDLANELFSPRRQALFERLAAEQREAQAAPVVTEFAPRAAGPAVVSRVPVPRPPDLARHALRDVDVTQIWPYVNPLMLFSKHLGLKGDIEKLLAQGDEKAEKLHVSVGELKHEILARKLLCANAIYRWFPVQADGDSLLVYDPDAPGEKILERFSFARQAQAPNLCLSDYVRKVGDEMDYVAFFAVTAGAGVREQAARWKDSGEYLKSHTLSALALETAEAFAERLHQRIRQQWGFPDAPGTGVRDLFKKKYRGCRYSFGYPACPNLADQEKLFRLLHPEEIGIELTEGHMMDPEASVSALVFHHPEADYFAV